MDIETFKNTISKSSGGSGNSKKFTYTLRDGKHMIIPARAYALYDCIKNLSFMLNEELKKAKITD